MSAAGLLGLAYLAAEANPGIWGQPVVIALLVLIGTMVTAGASAAATIYVKRLNKPVDDATTDRTRIEADKVRVDIHGREVEIARGLLDDIRKELERVRQDQERDREAMRRQLTEQQELAEKRHQQLAGELTSMREDQQHLQRQLEEHIPWDRAAHDLLRAHDPHFPEPPVIGGPR